MHTGATAAGPPRGRPAPGLRREPIAFFGGALLVRAALLLADAHPRFFLGDSVSYLDTRLGGWIPMDRSWAYGLVANAVLAVTHRLAAVIALQSAASALLCASAGALLRTLGVRRGLTWAVVVLLSLDPMLLYYDRSMMTDAPGAAAAWGGVALAAAAMVRGGAWRWALAAGCCWAAIALRTALLPLVVFVPAFTAAARAAASWKGGRRGRALLGQLRGPVALGLAVVAGLTAYATATGALTHSPPALNPRNGYFLLGTVAPILAPEDFRGLPVADPAGLLRASRADRVELRNEQIFLDWGLALRLERELPSWQAVSRAGTRLARRAVLRDPVGFGALVARNAEEYLGFESYARSFDGSFGLTRPLPNEFLASLATKVREPIRATTPAEPSLVLAVLRAWTPALTALAWLGLLAPLLALTPRGGGTRGVRLLLAASCWIVLAVTFLFNVSFSHRYLLPLSPLLATLVALALEPWLPPASPVSRAG